METNERPEPVISTDRLKKVEKIFSHASCYDGTAAAMICARTYAALGMDPDIKFIHYDEDEHDKMEAGPNQLFTDITPPRSRWEDWKGHDPIVLDHHESSLQATTGLSGVFGKNSELMCGAALAYEHVMRPLIEGTIPDFKSEAEAEAFCRLPEPDWIIPKVELAQWAEFARLCAIRDTWQEKHEDFEKAQGMMRCLGHHGSRNLLRACRDQTIELGSLFGLGERLHENAMWKAKLYAETAHIEEVLSQGETFKFGYFNCSEKLASEACHLLLNDHGCDVAFAYFMTKKNGKVSMRVSARSKKEEQGARVSARMFAEAFGGGGHWPAAGFGFQDAVSFSMTDLIQKTRTVLWQARGKK